MPRKFRKKIRIIFAFSLLIMLLTSCGNNDDQSEFLNYLNEDLPPVAEIENIVITEYDSVTGENYVDDYELYYVLNEIIVPNSLKLVDVAERIELSSKELREIHETYLLAINKQHSAFTQIMSAIETQDTSKISIANTELSEARKLMRDYMAELNAYANNIGIEISGSSVRD